MTFRKWLQLHEKKRLDADRERRLRLAKTIRTTDQVSGPSKVYT
jgi:hypothetical protein